MKKLLMILPMALILCFMVGCQDKEAKWHGTIDEKGGITVVTNPGEPMYGADVFVLEEELAITSQGREEEFIFHYTPNLVVDDEGNIYVLDTGAAQVIVFDKNGDLLRIFGKKGPGPGEMEYPLDFKINLNKELMVYDLAQFSLDFFTLNGEFLRDFSTSRMPNFRRPVVDSKGNIIAGFWNYGDEFRYELKKFNANLNPVYSLASQLTVSQPGISGFFERWWATNLIWNVTANDNILWGVFTKYEIFIHNPEGKLIKKIIKEHEGKQIGKNETDKIMGGPIPPYLKFPKKFPSFVRFTCDEEGRLFVQIDEKYVEEDEVYYDVFDAEGKYIVRIALKYRPQVWKNKRLYTLEEDEEGYQIVKRYKVTWKI